MKISPSILAADLTDLKQVLKEMDPAAVDLIHIDVMDGHFVPAISFGETYTKSVKGHTSIPLDVHLMVTHPEREVSKYYELAPYNITFHLETTHFPVRLSQEIHRHGIRTGVALNPGTSELLLEPILDHVDLILLMSVEPGFYGQSFLDSVRPKVRRVHQMVGDRKIEIQVDGGIGIGNIGDLARDGMDIAVAGSACFKNGDVNGNSTALKAAAKL